MTKQRPNIITSQMHQHLLKQEMNRLYRRSIIQATRPEPPLSARMFNARKLCKDVVKAHEEKKANRATRVGEAALYMLNNSQIDWKETINQSELHSIMEKRLLHHVFRNYNPLPWQSQDQGKVQRLALISKYVLKEHIRLRRKKNLVDDLDRFIGSDYQSASKAIYENLELTLQEHPVYKDAFAVMEYDEHANATCVIGGVYDTKEMAQLFADAMLKEIPRNSYKVFELSIKGGK